MLYEKRCSLEFRKIHRKTPVPEACNFIKKETLAQVFSCEFCEISENTFLTEHFRTTGSEYNRSNRLIVGNCSKLTKKQQKTNKQQQKTIQQCNVIARSFWCQLLKIFSAIVWCFEMLKVLMLYSKYTRKTFKNVIWCHSGVLTVNFEHITTIFKCIIKAPGTLWLI